MRILAIDDEPSILEVLSTALSTMGTYTVDVATSGADALEMIDDEDVTFDCFLVDIQMPGMDGVELCNEIRRNPDYRNTPILMVTAMSQMRYIDQAFSVGATDYVTKPFDLKQLRSRMAQARRLASRNAWVAQAEMEHARREESLGTDKGHGFTLPTAMSDGETIIGHGELENYVAQITRVNGSRSWALGVKLENAESLFQSLPKADFKAQLALVVAQLVKGLGRGSTMVSYRGNGLLLCIGHHECQMPEWELEKRVNDSLATCAENPHINRVVFGRKVPLDGDSIEDNMVYLKDAVEQVERVNDARNNEVTIPRRFLSFRKPTVEEIHLERKAYEVLLDNLLGSSVKAWGPKG